MIVDHEIDDAALATGRAIGLKRLLRAMINAIDTDKFRADVVAANEAADDYHEMLDRRAVTEKARGKV